MPLMNQEQIKAVLPHREPFLLVDEVTEMSDSHIEGKKYVRAYEPYFAGHFPGAPVMPGVLIIESIAQLGAIVVLSRPEFKGRIAYFGGMNKVRFRKMVHPGDELRLVMDVTGMRGSAGFGHGEAWLGDELAASCDLSFVVADDPAAQGE